MKLILPTQAGLGEALNTFSVLAWNMPHENFNSLYQGHQMLSVKLVQLPLLVVLALGGIHLGLVTVWPLHIDDRMET